jgi:NhaA family Na+:H+ antiporter
LLEGTLSTFRQAALPVFAAIGGMAMPALIYSSVNAGHPDGDMRGWAIPSATDIAFALGILALLGKRVPLCMKVFLTAVAVVDDLGAILIIAAFFTDAISLQALGVAAVAMAGLALLNRGGVRNTPAYLALGAVLWLAVLKSGVHATVAGVLLALFIPARAGGTGAATPPLERWEHALQPWVLFGIMPIFALANAGVVIAGEHTVSLTSPVSLGVALGLLLGNPIGITLMSWLAVRVGLSDLPEGMTWARLHAVSWLAGIGFTMSLFIAGLAVDGAALASAKLSLLVASGCAGLVGTGLLLWTLREPGAAKARNAEASRNESLVRKTAHGT